MRSFSRAAPVVAGLCGLLLSASVGLAETVKYWTEGVFNSSPTSNEYEAGNTKITFNGIAFGSAIEVLNVTTAPKLTNFGSWTVTGPDLETIQPGVTFTLTIHQLEPSPGGSTTFNSISYTGVVSSATQGLNIKWDPSSDVISTPPPGIKYTMFANPQNVGNNAPLTGTVQVMPLPPAVLAGGALMGCVGLYRRYRAAKLA